VPPLLVAAKKRLMVEIEQRNVVWLKNGYEILELIACACQTTSFWHPGTS